MTENPPAIVDVDTFVTFNWVIVVDPADSVVPTDVDPVMEADPAIERLLEPVMNPEDTPANVEVPVTFKRPPATMFPVLFKYIDCTPCSDDVPVTPKDPVTPRANPGVVVPIPTFAWLIRIASVRAPFWRVEKIRELVPAVKF